MATLQHIILIEDEPDIQTVVRMALEMMGGYQVTTFDSGEAAVAGIDGLRPDLILLDVMMPGMDGPTTLGHLRAKPALADTPVVFMTAKVQPQEIQTYRDLGAMDVIAKPFDPMTLADQVREIWERHTA